MGGSQTKTKQQNREKSQKISSFSVSGICMGSRCQILPLLRWVLVKMWEGPVCLSA